MKKYYAHDMGLFGWEFFKEVEYIDPYDNDKIKKLIIEITEDEYMAWKNNIPFVDDYGVDLIKQLQYEYFAE